MNLWIVEGIGDGVPSAYTPRRGMTVRDLKDEFAHKLGVSSSEVEVSTDLKRLTNETELISKAVNDGETVHIIPRAKAGQ